MKKVALVMILASLSLIAIIKGGIDYKNDKETLSSKIFETIYR